MIELIEDPNLFKILVDEHKGVTNFLTNAYSKFTILNFLKHPGNSKATL